MRILLTGFGPFERFAVNPSQQVVEAIARRSRTLGWNELAVEVLPTEFAAAGSRIQQLIREIRPGACICTGVYDGDSAIRLERSALNHDSAETLDAGGQRGGGGQIVPEGPDAYSTTLPLSDLQQALLRRGIPAAFSDDAGGYVCNHVFYLSCHTIASLGFDTRCGFIHIPPISEGGEAANSSPGLPFPMLVEAVECCLAIVHAVTPVS